MLIYKLLKLLGWVLSPFIIIILYITNLFTPIKLGILVPDRVGNFAVTTELHLRRLQLGLVDRKVFYLFVYDPRYVANTFLLSLFKRKVKAIGSVVLEASISRVKPILSYLGLFYDFNTKCVEFYEFNNASVSLGFTAEEKQVGIETLKAMGINYPDQQFICLFSRDSAYLKKTYPQKDWSYHDFRNLDIDVFESSVKYLIDSGYYVIRVGSIVEKPMSFSHSKLIDYPYTDFRSEFMDVFLSAHCKFILGTESGGTDLAILFDVPQLIVNNSIVGRAPWGRNGLYIPLRLKEKSSVSPLPYYECLKRAYDHCDNGLAMESQGIEHIQNTPDEILRVTQEMLNKLEGRFSYTEEDASLLKRYYSEFWVHTFSKDVKNPIGIDYLREYKNLFLKEAESL